ncbi:aldo/keto reductase [Oscillatoria amoena NRMC-F 0135]|nr:aldo/keto reductase [Oscillatoria amoena NRMC-F 0135]
MAHDKIRWGILGAGMISDALFRAMPTSETGVLAGIASRDIAKARAWVEKHQAADSIKPCGSYEELLADPAIDAVYIALPNSEHCRWVVAAAEAGKHILCEKPAASNFAELMVMMEAVRKAGVFFMEAFMWRCHPGTAAWLNEIRAGTLGQLSLIDAQFAFNCGENSTSNRFSRELSWGGIMDVGCYCVSAARLIAGVAQGKDFADPADLKALGHLGKSGVDEWSTAIAQFPGDIVASLSCGLLVNGQNAIRVYGSKGHLVVPSPWFSDGRYSIHLDGQEPTHHEIASAKNLYAHEVDILGVSVRAGRTEAAGPAMSWADTISQQKALDQWRKAAGVKFVCEEDHSLSKAALSGKALHFASTGEIAMGKIPGLEKPLSRVVMGCMALRYDDMAYTTAILDDYYERGGNGCDTAWVYGPNCEKALGRWIHLRGVRERFVILAKGAHLAWTSRPFHDPGCDPHTLVTQLHESLDRLGTDYVDIYCLHRDNPLIPVGEFVDCLNELLRAGRIRIFGGSNWTPQRIDEANAYARAKGLQGFSVISNNFSLAQWNEPMWANCVSSSDSGSLEWLKKSGVPLLAWSSQASGFFTGAFDRATPPDRDAWTREVARVWFNESNFERLDRVRDLARKKKRDPHSNCPGLCSEPTFRCLCAHRPENH